MHKLFYGWFLFALVHYFLIFIVTINGLQPLYAQPESVFNAYVQALAAEEWEKAETYWLPEEVEDIQSKISEICGTPWEEIQKKFAGYWGRFEFSGLVPGCLPSNEPMAIMKSAHFSAQIWDSDDAYLFEIRAATDVPNGVILMKHKSSSGMENYQSGLFAEHLPNARYDGEVYGIQFSPNEAGLYNYYTDNLVAKYISSFSPSNEYWNSEERVIRFRLEKSVLNWEISDFQLRLAEP